MPIDATRIKKLQDLLKLVSEGLTKEEFEKSFKAILDIILKIEKKNDGRFAATLEDLKEKIKKAIAQSESETDDLKSQLMGSIDSALKEQELGLNFIRDKVRKIKEGKDGYTPIKGKDYFDGLPGKNGNDGSPDTPEQILDKISGLLEIKDIKDLEKELEELRKIKTQRIGGGGTSDLGVAFSLARIIRTETPSGTINGVNKVFTVSTAINAILSFGINGMVIHDNEYAYSGATITFTTAIPADLSGTTFRIVFV